MVTLARIPYKDCPAEEALSVGKGWGKEERGLDLGYLCVWELQEGPLGTVERFRKPRLVCSWGVRSGLRGS
jgi:hypothetical protein